MSATTTIDAGPGSATSPSSSGALGSTGSPSADLTAVSTEVLEAEVVDLAGRISAATARLLDLVAELDRRSAWSTWGCRSMAHWLSWHAGVELGTAREQVRTARALEVLPLTSEQFRRGELSYSKARALTRVATPGTEADLVEVAATATAAQMERFVQAYRRSLVAEEERAVKAIDRRSVRWWWDDDGMLRMSVRLPSDDGAQVIAALNAALAALPSTTDDLHPRQADALAAMAEGFLAAAPITRTGGDRVQVHRADGGPTSLENLCLLCRYHHRLVHEGGYRIELADDGNVQVRHPSGWLLERLSSPAAPCRTLEPPEGGSDALRARWAGERFDLDHAVGSTRWSQIREGALPPVLPPSVAAGAHGSSAGKSASASGSASTTGTSSSSTGSASSPGASSSSSETAWSAATEVSSPRAGTSSDVPADTSLGVPGVSTDVPAGTSHHPVPNPPVP